MKRTVQRRVLGLALALGALPAALAGCDEPIRSAPVGSVEVTAPQTGLDVGQTVQLTATVRDEDGADLAGRTVSWSSSDPAVASVAEGLVTGRAPGGATITARVGGKQGQVQLTVLTAVARVTMEPDSFRMVVGNSVAIRVPTEDHNANALARLLAVPRDAAGNVLVHREVRFTSSDERVATVDSAGTVRALAPGVATVTARAGGGEGRLTVTVERPYTLTYLGTLPGLPGSRAVAINELGQVAGYSFTPVGDFGAVTGERGWVWQDGRLTGVVVPDLAAAGGNVVPVGIDERGRVGGLARTTLGLTAFLWDAGSVVAAPVPGPRIAGLGMNDRGEIVGGWMSDFCTRNCSGGAWIFRSGTVTAIGNHGSLRLTPKAINNAGQITGTVYQLGSGTESGRAFLLESATAAGVALPPTNPILSEGNDIDSLGRVFGHDLAGGAILPFSWRSGGAPTHFAPLRSGFSSSATAANDRGEAVGTAVCPGCPSPAGLPVLFRNGRAIRLEDLFVAGDWVFDTVRDVNDRGQIVGWGRHRTTGVTGALLLSPPQ